MREALSYHIQTVAQEKSFADGTPCLSISIDAVKRIAQNMRLLGRQVEIAALRHNIIPDRYLRNMKTLSVADQLSLLESVVCVIAWGAWADWWPKHWHAWESGAFI